MGSDILLKLHINFILYTQIIISFSYFCEVYNLNLNFMNIMAKAIVAGAVAASSFMSVSAESVYDFTVKNRKGEDVALSEYKGKVLLVVNTATRCGFTPQYDELEAIYQKYKDSGFEIIDFPCNQFGQQAPGSNEEIHDFCTMNFNIHFPQFGKIDVNGENELPLYTYLKAQKGFEGFDMEDKLGPLLDEMMSKADPDYAKKPSIKWNFTKFLISRDGKVLKRFEPTHKMSLVDKEIKAAVEAK